MADAFVDTSAWYAIIDRSDTDHPPAVRSLRRLARSRTTLVTTGHVLAELHRLLLHRTHRTKASGAVQKMLATPRLEVAHADEADLTAALKWLARFADQDFTLTDAIAFAIMERMKIRRAFAFDHDFSVAGFDLVA